MNVKFYSNKKIPLVYIYMLHMKEIFILYISIYFRKIYGFETGLVENQYLSPSSNLVWSFLWIEANLFLIFLSIILIIVVVVKGFSPFLSIHNPWLRKHSFHVLITLFCALKCGLTTSIEQFGLSYQQKIV